MKKRLFLVVCVLVSLFALFSCNKGIQTNEAVKLSSVSCYLPNEVSRKELKRENSIDYQYVIVNQEEKFIDMKIVLDNQNDYHIFDFNLKCSDNSKILLNNEYQTINEQKSINWNGDTNSVYIIHLQLEESIEKTNLQITGIYFSDRQDCSNKYSVDLNDKNNYSIYRLEEFENAYKGYDFEENKYIVNLPVLDSRINDLKMYVNKEEIETINTRTLADYDSFYITYTVTFDDIARQYTQEFKFDLADFLTISYDRDSVRILNNAVEENATNDYKISIYVNNELLTCRSGNNYIDNLTSITYGKDYKFVIEYKGFELEKEYKGE